MKVQTNGIETRYTVEGQGPWLTLSHSLACNVSMWDEQAQLLARKYKVLRYDTRGHGASSAPPGPYTLDQMADDVKALFDALGIRRTHWVGLSMGGMTAKPARTSSNGSHATSAQRSPKDTRARARPS